MKDDTPNRPGGQIYGKVSPSAIMVNNGFQGRGVTRLTPDIYRVPIEELTTFGGTVADDVISRDGAVILPKGTKIVLLGDSLLQVLKRLEDEGIDHLHVMRSDEVTSDALDSFVESVVSSNMIIDSQIARTSIREVKRLFESLRHNKLTPELVGPVMEMARELVEQILRRPKVLFSVARVRQWDEYTFIHSFNTAAIAGFLVNRMDPRLVEKAVLGGLLHDLGKAKIPLEILNKPGPLTDSEFQVIKTHPVVGEELAVKVGIDDPDILSIIREHHERWSGIGYPDGKSGESIGFLARVVAVADSFDAMTAERSYKAPIHYRSAVKNILTDSGTHFDPKVSRVLLLAFGLYPPGSVVELSDGSVGVVVSSGGEDLMRPVVLVKVAPDGSIVREPKLLDLKRSREGICKYLGWEGKRAL